MVGVVICPSIWMEFGWCCATRSDVVVPSCGLLHQRDANQGDILPQGRMIRRAIVLSVVGRVRARPIRVGILNALPLVLSLVAKERGGHGHHAMRCQEVREVEADIVWLWAEFS